ncbi:hypothetical protein PanWU01x14_207020, partial [Parasponia andersonii]
PGGGDRSLDDDVKVEETNCNEKKVVKQVFFSRSRLKLFKSKWLGPFVVVKVFPCEIVDIKGMDEHAFWVYNLRLKHINDQEDQKEEELSFGDLS